MENKCYHSLRRAISMRPILAYLMKNQPESGFTKRMSLDALKVILSFLQTEESLYHDIKQLYYCFKQNTKSRENLRKILITNTVFLKRNCGLNLFHNNTVVICEDGTFIKRCRSCCRNLCSKIVIVETRSTNSGVCHRCTQIKRNTTRLEKFRVTN